MGDKTTIDWADATWNPMSGCTKVSAGCEHCYAHDIAERFRGTPGYPDGFSVTCFPSRLDQPLRWKKSRRIFVCSMGDLFHDDVPSGFIRRVLDIIATEQRHTFLLPTKRPARLRNVMAWHLHRGYGVVAKPPPNLWLGVSVEDQATADRRIPELLATPAALRFVSYEPALGPLDLTMIAPVDDYYTDALDVPAGTGIDWVIAGGETGPHARPSHPAWFRSVRNQCAAAGVPFLFKQWGEWVPSPSVHCALGCRREIPGPSGPRLYDSGDGLLMERIGKRRAGRLLDGAVHDAVPGGKS